MSRQWGPLQLILAIAVAVIMIYIRSYGELFTINTDGSEFPITQFRELRSNKRQMIRWMRRFPKLRKPLSRGYHMAGQMVELGYRRTDKDELGRMGVQSVSLLPRLFDPHELDIYVNINTAQAYIYHSKKIDYDIDHFEYNEERREITVHYRNGKQYQLGVKIQWLIRPYLEDATSIVVIRTKDRQEIERVEVPIVLADLEEDPTRITLPKNISWVDVQQRKDKLKKVLDSSAPASHEALALAQNTVAQYTDQYALDIFINTSDEELLQKPAFCSALLRKLGFVL